jgi:hypothetical protein
MNRLSPVCPILFPRSGEGEDRHHRHRAPGMIVAALGTGTSRTEHSPGAVNTNARIGGSSRGRDGARHVLWLNELGRSVSVSVFARRVNLIW